MMAALLREERKKGRNWDDAGGSISILSYFFSRWMLMLMWISVRGILGIRFPIITFIRKPQLFFVVIT